MTHPPEVRQDAIARLTAGESQREVGKALGVSPGTIATWARDVPQAIIKHDPSTRERFATDVQIGAVKGLSKLLSIIDMANSPDYIRDIAYAIKCLSDVSLDWGEGRKGATVNVAVDNRSQTANYFEGLSIDEKRMALAEMRERRNPAGA